MKTKCDLLILGGSINRAREIDFLRGNGYRIVVISKEKPEFKYDDWLPVSLYDVAGLAAIADEYRRKQVEFEYLINCSGSKIEALIQLQYFTGNVSFAEEILISSIDKRYLRIFLQNNQLPHTVAVQNDHQELVVKPAISELGKIGVFKVSNLNELTNSLLNTCASTGQNSAIIFERAEPGEDMTIFYKIRNNKILKKRILREEFSLNSQSSFVLQKIEIVNQKKINIPIIKNIDNVIQQRVTNGIVTVCGKSDKNNFIIYEVGIGLGGDRIFSDHTLFWDWQEWL